VVTGLPYILVYKVVAAAEEETIAILHVIHGAQKWPPEN
jgi:hypothetical protein